MVNYLDLIIIRESARNILFYFFKAFEWVYHVGLFSHISWLFDVDTTVAGWVHSAGITVISITVVSIVDFKIVGLIAFSK